MLGEQAKLERKNVKQVCFHIGNISAKAASVIEQAGWKKTLSINGNCYIADKLFIFEVLPLKSEDHKSHLRNVCCPIE